MPEQHALYNGNLSADLLRISIPGKFQPTGSYNHTDKSGQLPKTETLRLRYSSLQRLWHWRLVSDDISKTNTNSQLRWCRLKLALPERPISLNTRLKIQANCSDCSYYMRCRNKLPYATETYRLTCFVSTIPGKFSRQVHTSMLINQYSCQRQRL